jgi:TolB-like protein/tetratricopeptide (TPR) repeat protein
VIGRTISRYRILSKLGAGGMGEVYLAEDTELGREVAVKVLPEAMAGSQERLERFRREARAVAALNHPNIVTIFNVEEAEGKRLLVMEHVRGRSLDRRIGGHDLPLPQIFDIAIPIAEALAAAHQRGITHRDLKPSNVMVDEESSPTLVKVLDFGLAKLAEGAGEGLPGALVTEAETARQPTPLTGVGTVMGTAPYMSPEQLQGKPVDHRSDIFSFGILLYEMVVGRRPFHGGTGIELASSILKDAPSSVVDIRSDVPFHLGRIIHHCLEKDPERRFQSAKDVRNELEQLRREVESGVLESTGALAQGPPGSASSTRNRLIAAALGLLLVAALAVLWWRGRGDEGPTRAPSTPADPAGEAQPTVAVLPFRNLGADESVDYLSLAVPDEITTTLSRAPGLAIRPFAASSQSAPLDPLEAARELAVGSVVTGQYFQEGERINLTLEAIDVGRNVVVWRESVVVNANELLSLRAAVADTVDRGLLPVLGGRAVERTGTRPSSEEAYALYLRSLPATSDSEPNARALEMLERAVELDPDYAPAWSELAGRYYYVGNYSDTAGDSDHYYDLSLAAAERALELDPDLIDPAVRKIVIDAERGRLEKAYDAAGSLLRQRPDAARAHFARSYVLRYGGAVDRAIRDCDTALALDPRNSMLRGCGITNWEAGRYDKALQFLALDPSSSLVFDNTVAVYLRQGRREEARRLMDEAPAGVWNGVMAYMDGGQFPSDAAERMVAAVRSLRDSEQQYWAASLLAYAGRYADALTLLREGVERGYCSYPFLQTDPLFDGLREDPASQAAYTAIVAAGKACHERFLAYIDG